MQCRLFQSGSDDCKFLIIRQTTVHSNEVLHTWRITGIISSANFLTNQVGAGSREQCLAGNRSEYATHFIGRHWLEQWQTTRRRAYVEHWCGDSGRSSTGRVHFLTEESRKVASWHIAGWSRWWRRQLRVELRPRGPWIVVARRYRGRPERGSFFFISTDDETLG